jgi:Na+/proline symporter
MKILAWAFLGGVVGSVLMDVTETYAAKVGITSGSISWIANLLYWSNRERSAIAITDYAKTLLYLSH